MSPGDGNLRNNNKYIPYFVNRKFAVDAASMGIFWVIIYAPVFLQGLAEQERPIKNKIEDYTQGQSY
jgi:hypothetical protein